MTDETNQETTNIAAPDHEALTKSKEVDSANKKYIFISVLVIVIILALIVTALIFLLKSDNKALTEQLRDVFIIFMALESLIIGIALVVLIVQLSTLINLLQNEVRPIINSTNETVNTIKGTARFVSDNLTEPVIKINQVLAMIKQLINPSNK
ncbi:MAG: hypothetical protein U9R53_01950 [Chloroflexota bacterium]|nr:hypothetical protein [Chloroflexota bacterium]